MTITVLAGTTQLRARSDTGGPTARCGFRPDPEVLRMSPGSAAATVLAALVTVLHRRGAQETVRVDRLGPEGGSLGSVLVDLSPETTFAGVLERVLSQPVTGRESSDVDIDVDAQFRVGRGEEERPGAVPRLTVWTDRDDELAAEFSYDPTRYAAVDIGLLADQVATALVEGVRALRRPIGTLPLVSDTERRTLDEWGGSGVAPAPARCVHELVADQAARTPDAVAVSCGGTILSYAELDARADRLARRLRDRGVGVDDVVGVLCGRSTELVVVLLAVLKAGAAYAAFDPDLPAARLEYLLSDVRTRLVVADPTLRDRVPAGLDVVDLVDLPDRPGLASAVPVGPDNLAYVSYTSGSTGEPKGAAVPHAAVSRLVREPDWAQFRPDDVFLMLAPAAFDASTLEIWAPLTTGGRLAVYPAGPVDIDALADVLREERVTVLWLTAGLFHQVAAARLEALSGLRHLLAGGDVVSQTQVSRLFAARPGVTFTNGYGPTENTTFTACWTSRRAPIDRFVPIGRPISGTSVRVLDTDLQPTPVGVPGELYAAGAGLARGYVHRPGPTADRFVPDPYGEPGARMYRTGDLVRWLPDGTLEFLGRADRQIKISGYRVEPGEIEAAIVHRADVREAVVVAQGGDGEGKRLVAYVVAEDPDDLHPRELARQIRQDLREELPGYMVPWAVVPLDSLPLNRNGKVDRAALPPASRAARTLPYEYVAPRTRIEQFIAALWGDVLGIEPIGVNDDFFELGGHSLIAAEILSRLALTLGTEITARTLYLRPTVAELADTLAELLPPQPLAPQTEKGSQS